MPRCERRLDRPMAAAGVVGGDTDQADTFAITPNADSPLLAIDRIEFVSRQGRMTMGHRDCR